MKGYFILCGNHGILSRQAYHPPSPIHPRERVMARTPSQAGLKQTMSVMAPMGSAAQTGTTAIPMVI